MIGQTRPTTAAPRRVYLDQNKWIELARIVHGKDASAGSQALLEHLQSAVASGRWVLPLSSVHYVELARISNPDRRHRLGAVMYGLSGAVTLAPTREIIEHEIEVALARRWPTVDAAPFALLGRGVGHAFGVDLPVGLRGLELERLERAVLAGDAELGVASPTFDNTVHRERFQRHLQELKDIRDQLPSPSWDDALQAISMIDILDPLNRVLARHGLDIAVLTSLDRPELVRWLQTMPSRRVDLHLHRQVLKDLHYRPKVTDLEDWAALSIASVYCDVVVCEKHMAAMLKRDHFQTPARVETRLADAVQTAESLDEDLRHDA